MFTQFEDFAEASFGAKNQGALRSAFHNSTWSLGCVKAFSAQRMSPITFTVLSPLFLGVASGMVVLAYAFSMPKVICQVPT